MGLLNGVGLGILFIGVLIGLAIVIMYLLNLQNALKEVSDENRDVPAVNAWLLLIPFFTIVYAFIFYPKMSSSFKKEFEARGFPAEGDYLKNLGIAYAILGAITALLNYSVSLSLQISGFFSLASIIVFIVLWVKAAKIKNILKSTTRNESGEVSNNSKDLLDN